MTSAGELQAAGPAAGPAGALAAAASGPTIAQLNVSDNSRMHIGPKFVSVTQTVHTTDVVKEVGFARYVWEWARSTSRCERAACGTALAVLLVCGTLVAVLLTRTTPEPPDVAPHAWNISRRMWALGEDKRTGDEEDWSPAYLPLRLVVVQHTAGGECHRFADCAALMRNLQDYYFRLKKYDLPYNFVIGNEGRVYEGRGWGVVGAHTQGFNRCALGIAFTGDYRAAVNGPRPTDAQLESARLLIDRGVRASLLHPRVRVIAACDVKSTKSPGDLLYKALQQWPYFMAAEDAERFRDSTCDAIYPVLLADDDADRDSYELDPLQNRTNL